MNQMPIDSNKFSRWTPRKIGVNNLLLLINNKSHNDLGVMKEMKEK